jgi:hypothetical protein
MKVANVVYAAGPAWSGLRSCVGSGEIAHTLPGTNYDKEATTSFPLFCGSEYHSHLPASARLGPYRWPQVTVDPNALPSKTHQHKRRRTASPSEPT